MSQNSVLHDRYLNVPKMNRTDIYGRRIKYDMDKIEHSLCLVSVNVFLWVTLRQLTYVGGMNITANSVGVTAQTQI